MSAWRSLWKQLPPYPGPAFRNNPPISVETDSLGHCADVYAGYLLGDICDCVDEADLGGEEGVTRVLDQLSSLRTSQDNRRELGTVEPSDGSCELGSCSLIVGSNNFLGGVGSVIDRASLYHDVRDGLQA